MAQTFVNHIIKLVMKERDEKETTTSRLLSGTPTELGTKGVAILNLKVSGE